jgi:hypothetical protein
MRRRELINLIGAAAAARSVPAAAQQAKRLPVIAIVRRGDRMTGY